VLNFREKNAKNKCPGGGGGNTYLKRQQQTMEEKKKEERMRGATQTKRTFTEQKIKPTHPPGYKEKGSCAVQTSRRTIKDPYFGDRREGSKTARFEKSPTKKNERAPHEALGENKFGDKLPQVPP